MKHLTLGVAGHIDHGKTALVRALTGIDTDRLPEERERGMSIVLGFAHLALRGGEVDVIDVPGHEKFVRTMIAGATGLDAALLTVAANESVKPQTVEHVALLGLLGVTRGAVTVTKSDLVPEQEERAWVTAEVRDFLNGTFLRDAPLVWTSSLTGEGLSDVRAVLQDLLADAPPVGELPWFTLPLDRAFTVQGHGTVATGTLRRGALRVGQTVQIWPGGREAEVRGLQVHGQDVQTAQPGGRVAVNLRGVKKEDLPHGAMLATVGLLRSTRLLDAELVLPPTAAKPLRRGQTVTLHHGTAEAAARAFPLGQSAVSPGETAFVQFRLAEEVAVPAGEPFIIRLPSPAETLGGGVIFDPYPQKHTRDDEAVSARVRILAHGTAEEKIAAKLWEAGPQGRDLGRLTRDLGLSDLPPNLPLVHCPGGLALHPDVFDALCVQAQDLVQTFHETHRLRRGMPLEELRRGLPRGPAATAFSHLLESLAQSGTVETVDGLARVTGYSPASSLSPVERAIADEIEAAFRCAGLKPPDVADVLRKDRRRKTLFGMLSEAGVLVPTGDRAGSRTVVFHREALEEAECVLRAALADGAGRTVSEINALLDTTRKFSVPLLEHWDAAGVTRRAGDLRFLACAAAESAPGLERPG